MASVLRLEGTPVVGARGRRLGVVERVLFAPREPLVVGIQVRPRRLLRLIARRERFVVLARLTYAEREIRLSGKRLPSAREAAAALGGDWEETVAWRGMPVLDEDGEAAGVVHDADVSLRDGSVRSLALSGGVATDAAVGRGSVPGGEVIGFDGAAVRIARPRDDVAVSGGAAASAGKATAAVKVHGGRVAKKAYDTGVAAAIAVGRAARRSAKRGLIKRLKDAATVEEDEPGA